MVEMPLGDIIGLCVACLSLGISITVLIQSCSKNS